MAIALSCLDALGRGEQMCRCRVIYKDKIFQGTSAHPENACCGWVVVIWDSALLHSALRKGASGTG
jgi:hypothetical protein